MKASTLVAALSFALLALTVGSSPAQAQSDDCGRYCRTSSNALTTCNDRQEDEWFDDVHTYHEASFACTNFGTETPTFEGFCTRAWLNGASTSIDCKGTNCTIAGSIKCGGVLRSYSIECGGVNGAPRASAYRDSASCQGLSFSNYVQCDGETGNLVYGLWQ